MERLTYKYSPIPLLPILGFSCIEGRIRILVNLIKGSKKMWVPAAPFCGISVSLQQATGCSGEGE
jgi:hypothetical protein